MLLRIKRIKRVAHEVERRWKHKLVSAVKSKAKVKTKKKYIYLYIVYCSLSNVK